MPSRAFWAACLRILAAALGVFLFVRFLLPVLLPFLIGLLVALLAQRPIDLCTNRLHAPRTLAAFFCTLLLSALLGSAIFNTPFTADLQSPSTYLHTWHRTWEDIS